jgi:integrase
MHAQRALLELGMEKAPPTELTARAMRELTSIHADKPATGCHRFGAISRFLDYLLDEEVIEHNVAKDISRRFRPKAPAPRDTHYSIDQLRQLWFPQNPLRDDYLRFVRFMVVCPLRMSEAAELTGENIYFDIAELRLSADETKNAEAFTLPLPNLAIELLKQDKIAPELRCFQLSSKDGAPMKSWAYFTKAVRRASGVEHFNLHDLRRTFVTLLSEHSHFSEGLVDSLLNHNRSGSRTGVLRHYQHAKNIKQRREIMDWWATFLVQSVEVNSDVIIRSD